MSVNQIVEKLKESGEDRDCEIHGNTHLDLSLCGHYLYKKARRKG